MSKMSSRRTQKVKRKLGFPLAAKDGWPPYEVEHLWAELIDGMFKIKSFPFYLKGVSYDDIIRADVDEYGYVLNYDHIQRSKNTIVWIIENSPTDVCRELVEIGCGVEQDPSYKLISVNVPALTTLDKLNKILTKYEDSGKIEVAIPDDRIGLLAL